VVAELRAKQSGTTVVASTADGESAAGTVH
jgi:hypothetical protein